MYADAQVPAHGGEPVGMRDERTISALGKLVQVRREAVNGTVFSFPLETSTTPRSDIQH